MFCRPMDKALDQPGSHLFIPIRQCRSGYLYMYMCMYNVHVHVCVFCMCVCVCVCMC